MGLISAAEKRRVNLVQLGRLHDSSRRAHLNEMIQFLSILGEQPDAAG